MSHYIRQLTLSAKDIAMLKYIMEHDGRKISSTELSKQLDIPITTAQRKLKRIHNDLIDVEYNIKEKALGLQRVVFIVSLRGGLVHIANQISKIKHVCGIESVLGRGTGLLVEALVASKKELVSVMDVIYATEGVESVELFQVIDQLNECDIKYNKIDLVTSIGKTYTQ